MTRQPWRFVLLLQVIIDECGKTFCSCGHNNTVESSRCEHVLLVIKFLGLPKEDLLISSDSTTSASAQFLGQHCPVPTTCDYFRGVPTTLKFVKPIQRHLSKTKRRRKGIYNQVGRSTRGSCRLNGLNGGGTVSGSMVVHLKFLA